MNPEQFKIYNRQWDLWDTSRLCPRTTFVYIIHKWLVMCLKYYFPIFWADDTSIFIEGETVDKTIEILNNVLKQITTWLSTNKLTLNVMKSHYMIFHRSRIKNNNHNIEMGNTTLQQVYFTKFLGVIIDDKLNFIHHISYIKNKISKGMGILLKARNYLNKTALINVYTTFIYPYLIYGI